MAAAEEDDDSKSIPNYDLDCGDNVARRPTIDEGAHGLYLAGSWIGQCRMCPPPEQDALASAREPLLESEPTSPLSPLSIAPAEAPEDGLFRTTTITHLLENCGGVFADKCEYDADAEGADRLYARSSPPRGDEEVAFVSHAWQDSAYLKWLALCYRSNLGVAVVASSGA